MNDIVNEKGGAAGSFDIGLRDLKCYDKQTAAYVVADSAEPVPPGGKRIVVRVDERILDFIDGQVGSRSRVLEAILYYSMQDVDLFAFPNASMIDKSWDVGNFPSNQVALHLDKRLISFLNQRCGKLRNRVVNNLIHDGMSKLRTRNHQIYI